MRDLLLSMFGPYVFSQFSALLGALVVWPAIHRGDTRPVEPADVFDGYEADSEPAEEDTKPEVVPELARWFAEPVADWWRADDEDPEPDPEPERVIALRPMSALERLEGPTRRIIRGPDGYEVEPYWFGGRHRKPESRCRVPSFLAVPQATAEFPELGRHRSGEYPVLDGVSG